jgi:predicted transcriptional regulator
MSIRRFRAPINMTITIRHDDNLLAKVDVLAMAVNRSRTDLV